MTLETLVQLWPILGGFAAFIVWLARLEAGMRSNNRAIKDLNVQRKDDLLAAKDARDDTNKMLKEVRDDIKGLISQVSTAMAHRS